MNALLIIDSKQYSQELYHSITTKYLNLGENYKRNGSSIERIKDFKNKIAMYLCWISPVN